jgi:hypothetical protein
MFSEITRAPRHICEKEEGLDVICCRFGSRFAVFLADYFHLVMLGKWCEHHCIRRLDHWSLRIFQQIAINMAN